MYAVKSKPIRYRSVTSLWQACLGTSLVIISQPALGNPPPGANAETVFSPTSFLTQRETWAAFAILFFGLLMALVATYLARNKVFSGTDTIRLTALILVVTGTLFLVTAGYDAQQIAPALGLLGTVAGYMLGRSEDRRRQTPPDREREDDETE